VQMLDWFKRRRGPSSHAGIFEYYRQLTEEARGHRPAASLACDCASFLASARGICSISVEMLEEEAKPFLRVGWARVDDQ